MSSESEDRRAELERKNAEIRENHSASPDAVLIANTIELAATRIADMIDHAGERIFYMLDQFDKTR